MSENWRSSLEVIEVATGAAQVVLRTPRLIEAPNWHPEGGFLVNGEGRLWRASANGLVPVDIGGLDRCNNDHGFLPDGRLIFSCHNGQGSGIYVLDADGPRDLGLPRPSWWHGAGGGRIAYACVRGGDRVVRVAVAAEGGTGEVVLTPGPGHHDGPDIGPDGAVWWNSDGDIWALRDGMAAPVVRDERVNWFPHPSPCGSWVSTLSYPPGTEGHPRDLAIEVRVMRPDGTGRRVLAAFNGGQGTMNVPHWSPDGRHIAVMRYAPLAEDCVTL